MKIDKNIRQQVYERDNYTCFYCGDKVVLTKDIQDGDYRKEACIDHVIPVSKGGTDDIENLRTSCRTCNSQKKDKTINDIKLLQNNDGYTKVHNIILEKLVRFRLSGREYMIVLFIIRKTYGFNKEADWIALVQIARETGIRIQHISTLVNKLIDRKILTKNGKYLSINKYTHQWKDLPKRVTLPKKVINLTENGNSSLPKMVNTKDIYTKDNIQKKYMCDFNSFWKKYPRKVKKKKAEEKYIKRAKSKQKEEEIMQGLDRYIKKWHDETTDIKYIPHPTTWLNNEMWNDEVIISNEQYNKNARKFESDMKEIKNKAQKIYKEDNRNSGMTSISDIIKNNKNILDK